MYPCKYFEKMRIKTTNSELLCFLITIKSYNNFSP